MRPIWNNLGDPGLHLLAIALLLAYLAFAGGSGWGRDPGEMPLDRCKACHAPFLPEKPCGCGIPGRIAQAMP